MRILPIILLLISFIVTAQPITLEYTGTLSNVCNPVIYYEVIEDGTVIAANHSDDPSNNFLVDLEIYDEAGCPLLVRQTVKGTFCDSGLPCPDIVSSQLIDNCEALCNEICGTIEVGNFPDSFSITGTVSVFDENNAAQNDSLLNCSAAIKTLLESIDNDLDVLEITGDLFVTDTTNSAQNDSIISCLNDVKELLVSLEITGDLFVTDTTNAAQNDSILSCFGEMKSSLDSINGQFDSLNLAGEIFVSDTSSNDSLDSLLSCFKALIDTCGKSSTGSTECKIEMVKNADTSDKFDKFGFDSSMNGWVLSSGGGLGSGASPADQIFKLLDSSLQGYTAVGDETVAILVDGSYFNETTQVPFGGSGDNTWLFFNIQDVSVQNGLIVFTNASSPKYVCSKDVDGQFFSSFTTPVGPIIDGNNISHLDDHIDPAFTTWTNAATLSGDNSQGIAPIFIFRNTATSIANGDSELCLATNGFNDLRRDSLLFEISQGIDLLSDCCASETTPNTCQSYVMNLTGNAVQSLPVPAGSSGAITNIRDSSSGFVVFTTDGTTPVWSSNGYAYSATTAMLNPINTDLSLVRFIGTAASSNYQVIYEICQ